MAVEAYAYNSTLARYQRLLSGTIGYEKIIRTIQYFCHFYAWQLASNGHPQNTIDVHHAIKKNCGGIRKALRLTKFIDHFKLAAMTSNVKPSDRVERTLGIGRQLGYAFFILLDNLTYPDSTGIRRYAAAAFVLEMAHYAWLSALVCSIMLGLYTLGTTSTAAKKPKAGQSRSSIPHAQKVAKRATLLQLVSDMCDCTIVINFLGLFPLEDGVVGLAGTLSSIIGLTAAWQKTA